MENITTRNRKLEQFLYLHGIQYIIVRKDEDGMTVWEYQHTKEVADIVEEFHLVQKRISRREKGA